MKKNNTRIVKPARLLPGDIIGIVAPASSFDIENFKQGIKKLRKLGYKVKYERSIFNKCWSRPGHNKQRGEQINRMFRDKDVKAIFCAKAGYGSVEIVPYLNRDVIRENPKIFIGYSDVTILLLYLQNIANMVVFHGPVVSDEIYEGMNEDTLSHLQRVVASKRLPRIFTYPDLVAFKPGKCTGRIVGGNLSLIVDALGTPYEIDTADRVVFLEDVNEDLEAIKKYLVRMKEAGKFAKIKGVVFGKMVDCFDKRRNLQDIVTEVFAEKNVPVLFGFPSGHAEKKGEFHFTLPLGVKVSIDAGVPKIRINEAAVA